ncbi:hypothetical protein [Mycobacterium sp. DL440]|uniref:hypothetical protein n=1 Tax=Mycobacterium sp. DL440 TaxID=2675523 RepID=UPI00141DC7FE|nr:hypothetical protein [Mycobacterium sp. DL440]
MSGNEPTVSTDDERRRFVRRLALESLERRGVRVRPAPQDALGDDWFMDPAGNHYRLYNLQLQCAQRPPAEWVGAVEFHFDQQFTSRSEPEPAELSDAEFLAQVRTRLQTPDTSSMISMRYARLVFDGLVAELSRDLPTVVKTVGDDDVAGRDLDFLYEVGQRNTDAEPVTVQALDRNVFALTGDSFFIASKALNMPRMIETVLGRAAPLGVVFSVPHRSLLFLHAVGESTADAAEWIASVTVGRTENPPGGAVSRDTYFWHGGTVQRITHIDTQARSINLLRDGAFGEAMRVSCSREQH